MFIGGAAPPMWWLFIVLLAGALDAAVLRSSDGVDHVVNSTAAAALSRVLHDVIAEAGDRTDAAVDVIPLERVVNAQLVPIVDYINRTALISSCACPATTALRVISVRQTWQRDWVAGMALEAKCELLSAVDYLDMRVLMGAVAYDIWSDVIAWNGSLPNSALRPVVDNCANFARLDHVANTTDDRAIVARIREIVVYGGNISLVNEGRWGQSDDNLLQWAATKDEERVVQVLIILPGIDLHVRDASGRTPLHLAAMHGHVRVVEALLRAPGIRVYLVDGTAMTPLHKAAIAGHVRVVELLAKAPGIAVSAADFQGTTPLHVASALGHVRVVEALLAVDKVKVNARDDLQMTPLHRAAIAASRNVTKVLLKAPDIEINAGDSDNRTPLHWAVQARNDRVVAELLKASGCDVNARDNDYRTPLHMAVDFEEIDLLTSAPGIDVNACDKNMCTPLHLAAGRNADNAISGLLNARGIDVNAYDNNLRTPLHVAVAAGHASAVLLLTNADRIDVNALDKFGMTPMRVAAVHGQSRHTEGLLRYAGGRLTYPAYEITPFHRVVTVVLFLLLVRAVLDALATLL
ncbi:Ankyrin repeat domain-containing protein [Plasmodiophora brassicae]